MKKSIQSPNAPAPLGPYSPGIQAGNTYYFSGQIAIDPATGQLVLDDVTREAHQVMKNLQSMLANTGLTFDHVVKTSIFLKSMDDFATINEVYGSYLSEPYPARETVEVARLPKNVNVEISVIAVKA